jgi:ribonuclease M5
VSPEARLLREKVGIKLGIGYGNSQAILKTLKDVWNYL